MTPSDLLASARAQSEARANRHRELEAFHRAVAEKHRREAEELETMTQHLTTAASGLQGSSPMETNK